ncbi:MAG TPA: YfcE family phosphodiesterase [Methanomassiliicoccales archaeon]|nr:YfcE family phosphodiesterase [Methanomassiliicoccales archaeon]
MTAQLEALMKEGEGVLAQKDVENVHRMRVASRRVRAALETFEDCLPADRAGSWRKEMRLVTRALGAARDADVQIGFLKGAMPSSRPEDKPGMRMVLDLKTKERAGLQLPLVKILQDLERNGLPREMLDFFRKEKENALKARVPHRSPMAFEKAWERVHGKVEELTAHEPYVHQEDAVAEHHAMRISAKRLRYALELVHPLFDDGLEQEIAQVKKLQELLGDLHDCDVWVQELEKMASDLEKGGLKLPKGTSAKKVGPGIDFLERDRSRQRKETYGRFVALWDSLVEKGYVESLLRRLEAAADQTEDLAPKAIEMLVRDPGAKVAVIGDVHGNLQALEAVLKDAKRRGADIVLNTGDMLGYGANPEESVRLLRSLPSISVIGNYDLKAFRIHDRKEPWPEGKSKDKLLSFEWAYDHVSPSTRAWLKSLPKEVRIEVGGTRLLMVHGSPDSMDEHLGPETPVRRLEEIARTADADLLIMGHSHRSMSRMVGGTRFLNPGSVGRQDDGDPRASYAILRLQPFMVSLNRVAYDVKGAARAIKEAGLPRQFARMIKEGRAYDRVVGKGEEGRVDRQTALALSWQVARTYIGDDPHTKQVSRLALILFDCLSERLGLSGEDRLWLECAAILHDIGWSEGRRGHHKTSLRMILEEDALPFDRNERRAIGSIARYHRKALPDPSDAHYSNLGKKDRRRVTALAAILRVADALDSSHNARIGGLRCQFSSGKLVLVCEAAGSLEMEEMEVTKKGDLMKKALGLDIELRMEVAR